MKNYWVNTALIEARRKEMLLLEQQLKFHANRKRGKPKISTRFSVKTLWVDTIFFCDLFQVVHECNDSALIEGRRKEMLLLEQQLKFRGDVKLFPLCSASRWLVKRGDATRIYWKENAEAKLTFGRKVSKQSYNFLLFNDILVIAKKKR